MRLLPASPITRYPCNEERAENLLSATSKADAISRTNDKFDVLSPLNITTEEKLGKSVITSLFFRNETILF